MSRPRNDEGAPAKSVFLLCELREKYNDNEGKGQLRSVISSANPRCNIWTRHTVDRLDADGTLHYKCSECGSVRVFGSWGGDPAAVVIGS